MAFQVGSVCYPTALQAAQASASSQAGAIVTRGDANYIVDITTVSANSITYKLMPIGLGNIYTGTSSYAAQPCNMLQASDGLQLGWLIAAVWLGAYGLLFVTRALRGETGSEYGNT